MKYPNQQTNKISRYSKGLIKALKSFSAVVALVALQSLAAQAQVSFSVYAGTTASPGYTGDGGHRLSAEFHDPWGIAIDNYNGLLYVIDHYNHAVRQVNIATDVITTYAGGSAGFGGDGGPATSASLQNPTGMTIDGSGNIYIYDIYNFRIRMVEYSSGTINTIIGTGTSGYSGDGGAANLADIGPCNGLASDFSGNIYLPAYGSDRIRTITPSGISSPGTITSYAGTSSGFSGDGSPIGGTEQFNYLNDMKHDWNTGNQYISDWSNNRIRKIDASGNLSTFAGNGSWGFVDNVPATSAPLNGPMGFDLNCQGDLYFCDVDNHVIRKIDPSGLLTTVAGHPTVAGTGAGGDVPGEFNRPVGLAVDAIGDIYVSDRNNHRIVKLTFEAKVCLENTITLCDKTGTGTWSSSDPSIAPVDASGVVTGVSAGTAVITLNIGGIYSLTKTVTVTPPPTAISGPTTVAVGSSITLSDATPGGTWSSSGTSASVDPATGVVTGVATGVETITYSMSPGCFEVYTVSVEKGPDPVKKCIDDARLTITSKTGEGGCDFTATITTTTSYTIVGYEWTLPAPTGTIVVHTSSPTDIQNFSLPIGSSFIVHVKIHVVKADFGPGESPCCEMDVEKEVRCDGKGGEGACFIEALTTLTATSVPGAGDPTACDFTLTANAVPAPGMTITGYIWSIGGVLYPMSMVSVMPASLSDGTTETESVTIYAVDAMGKICVTRRFIHLECAGGSGTWYKPAAGGDKLPVAAGINIFPNPTSGEVEIISGDTEIQNVQVIDVNGKKMGNYDFTQTKSAKVSLTDLPPGNYLFRVNNSTSKVVTKIK